MLRLWEVFASLMAPLQLPPSFKYIFFFLASDPSNAASSSIGVDMPTPGDEPSPGEPSLGEAIPLTKYFKMFGQSNFLRQNLLYRSRWADPSSVKCVAMLFTWACRISVMLLLVLWHSFICSFTVVLMCHVTWDSLLKWMHCILLGRPNKGGDFAHDTCSFWPATRFWHSL